MATVIWTPNRNKDRCRQHTKKVSLVRSQSTIAVGQEGLECCDSTAAARDRVPQTHTPIHKGNTKEGHAAQTAPGTKYWCCLGPVMAEENIPQKPESKASTCRSVEEGKAESW